MFAAGTFCLDSRRRMKDRWRGGVSYSKSKAECLPRLLFEAEGKLMSEIRRPFMINKLGIQLAVVLLIVFMTFFPALATERPPNTLTLKVARFPMNGYYERDESGGWTGYGVEFLNALEQCSDISFEYVDAETWQDALKLTASGGADIVAPAQRTKGREAVFSFLTYPIAYEYGGLLALNSREDLSYEDFDVFSNLTLGCTKGQVFEEDYRLFARDHGFSERKIKYYETWPALERALKDGKVDAIITNMMYDEEPFKVIARFGGKPSFIMVRRGRSDVLSVLENAVNRLGTESPNYRAGLTNKYFPQYKKVPFTRKELDFIASSPAIKVLCDPSEEPFVHRAKDSAAPHGVSISVLKRISEISGLKFEYLPVENRRKALDMIREGKGDIIPYDTYNFNWAHQENVYHTVPYMSAQMVAVVGRQNGVAAMVDGRFFKDDLAKKNPHIKILACNSVEECIKAVKSGKAGYTIINGYEASFMLDRFQGAAVREGALSSIHQICMSVSKKLPPELRSVLGKSMGQISDTEIYGYVTESLNRHNTVTLSGLILRHPYETAALIFVLAVVIAGLLYSLFVSRLNSRKNRELETAVKNAKKASKAKSDFLSNMSHDIRTPMNAIINLTNLAMDDIRDEARLLSDLDKIKISSDFLLGLINDILDMSRIESGRLKLEPKIYTAERFENYLNGVMLPIFTAKNINLKIGKIGVVPALYVDEIRFNQIFFNLLSNAAKYTPEGGTVTFALHVLEADDSHFRAEYVIKDNGIGMSEEFVRRAFEPFEREKTVEAFTGTGLGLAITKAIVEALGGTIKLESEQGKGTTVTLLLDLPIPDARLVSESLIKKNSEGIYQLASVMQGHALVAEDHPINREVIVRLLKKQGLSVDCVENGAMAVEAIEHSPEDYYQFVLMDIRMPVMDGLTATRRIRALANRRLAEIPIIAMTADAFVEDRNKCVDAGMNDYLSKPVNVSELMAIVRRILSGQVRRRRERILVVDDAEINIAVMRAAIEKDFEVLEACDGVSALECLERNRGIVAVITDIQMPNMDGTELIRRIRADVRYDNVAIIANTLHGDTEQEERLLLSGADDFVYKPTTPGIVITRLFNVLKNRKMS